MEEKTPSYEQILTDLNIPIIKDICPSKPMKLLKSEKTELKLKNLFGITYSPHNLYFLKFVGSRYYLKIKQRILTKTKKGVNYTQINVITNKY